MQKPKLDITKGKNDALLYFVNNNKILSALLVITTDYQQFINEVEKFYIFRPNQALYLKNKINLR